MRKRTALLPITMLMLAAFPAPAQDVTLPRVLFCMGQCFGVAKNGDRIPVTKGTELAPGLKLETGPNSYLQVKFGPDIASGIGENARVRFEPRIGERDVVILDQGRIRMIGGELIGRPAAQPVELRTTEGTIVLRSADIEVKSLPTIDTQPALTLVKLNVGDARLGELPVSKDVVHGIVGGKILERAIPIGDIALPTPREPAPSGPGGVTERAERPPFLTLPVVNLPVAEAKPIIGPIVLSPAIVSPTLPGFTQLTNTTLYTQLIQPKYLVASDLIMSDSRIAISSGGSALSLNDFARDTTTVQVMKSQQVQIEYQATRLSPNISGSLIGN